MKGDPRTPLLVVVFIGIAVAVAATVLERVTGWQSWSYVQTAGHATQATGWLFILRETVRGKRDES